MRATNWLHVVFEPLVRVTKERTSYLILINSCLILKSRTGQEATTLNSQVLICVKWPIYELTKSAWFERIHDNVCLISKLGDIFPDTFSPPAFPSVNHIFLFVLQGGEELTGLLLWSCPWWLPSNSQISLMSLLGTGDAVVGHYSQGRCRSSWGQRELTCVPRSWGVNVTRKPLETVLILFLHQGHAGMNCSWRLNFSIIHVWEGLLVRKSQDKEVTGFNCLSMKFPKRYLYRE